MGGTPNTIDFSSERGYILFQSLSILKGDSLKTNFIGAVALLPLLLSGCSGAPQSTPTAPTVEAASASSTTTPIPSPADAKSLRGNLVKVPGQGVSVVDPANGKTVASFVVNSVKLDPKCTSEFAKPPANGHFVVLDVSMETTPALAESAIPEFGISHASGWKAIAANGTTFNGDLVSLEAITCLKETERFPSTLGPAEKATGKIVFDVPTPAGVLVQKQGFMRTGWEWTYPSK